MLVAPPAPRRRGPPPPNRARGATSAGQARERIEAALKRSFAALRRVNQVSGRLRTAATPVPVPFSRAGTGIAHPAQLMRGLKSIGEGVFGATKQIDETVEIVKRSGTIALDADALVKGWTDGRMTDQIQSLLQDGDQLVVTPNLVRELRESLGISNVDDFLNARGVSRSGADTTGAALPATKLRQQLDQIKANDGNQGDALNVSEAGAINADLFITADKRATSTPTGSNSGTVMLPNSGGAKVDMTAIDDPHQ